ncbi:MAG: methylated-DNA--[protein]-cysteine S-methyltransferase [Acidobacteriaceae bacterium]|nr:methylated-DNA--[protein]-cysteine S-methyltransferase [Acidobacteriaceae bacterium]MBV9503277.1 methylated-DNA--[protein]-cysteine S-methyltransferase [Acidobacteriaceae bacterium]
MWLYIAEESGNIVQSSVCDDQHPRTEDEFISQFGGRVLRAESDVLSRAAAQVAEYFAGVRLDFDLPFYLAGTPFQRSVWNQLLQIPFGVTRTYGELAETIGHPTAFRAVGNANGRNNLPVFVPCHRVLASGGKLGGFTGGIGLKKRLLAHEAAVLAARRAA